MMGYVWVPIKNVKGLDFFFYFHASSLACNSFMADSGRRHGTPGSETRTCRGRGINFIIPPSALGMTWIDPPSIHNWFVSQLRNLEFRKFLNLL